MNDGALARFGAEYAKHRAAEGRGYAGDDLLKLPYLRSGAFARQWQVRARGFEAFLKHGLMPHAIERGRPLQVIDLGAGNGWLSYRIALQGHQAIALDIRDDAIDGLGAGEAFAARAPDRFQRLVAPFDAIPLPAASLDIALFNASLHYSVDLAASLREAARVVRPGGRIVILDSPFYRREEDGVAMVAEKHAAAAERFGDGAQTLMSLPFIEFLTEQRLRVASETLELQWRRRRVLYPLWYELRPLRAALKGERAPSRFDLWVSLRP